MFIPSEADLNLADSMIEMHGARAVSEAQCFFDKSARTGDRDAATQWFRVMSLIEFSELRPAIHL
ncbi:MAG: hypothetical protein ABI608_07495 [Rhizomicrobium sp.]